MRERTPQSDRDALAGATLIGEWLPGRRAAGRSRGPHRAPARPATPELRSAPRCALGTLAQALGGRYGKPHGALNALTSRPRSASTRPSRARRSPLRRRARPRRSGTARRAARPTGWLRAPARPRHPGGRSVGGGRVRGRPPRAQGDAGDRSRRRGPDPLDLVSLQRGTQPRCRTVAGLKLWYWNTRRSVITMTNAMH